MDVGFDVGTVIDSRYEIVDEIDRGGYTIVHEAEDIDTRSRVVLKSPNDSSFNDDVRTGFDYELRSLRTLDLLDGNPHLMKLYNPIEDHDNVFAVEFLGRRDLVEVASTGWSEDNYGKQVIRAFATLHQAGIIHRDLAPANVMVFNGNAKVIDFNCARPWPTCSGCGARVRSRDATTKKCPSCDHERKGYRHFKKDFGANRPVTKFKPPEAVSPKVDAAIDGFQGPWSDVYALGKLLVYLLDGAVYQESDFDPRDRRIDCPGFLAKIIERATATDPANRYETARGLLRAIENEAPNRTDPVAELEEPDGNRIEIEPGTSLGRTTVAGQKADVELGSDDHISRQHASIEFEAGRWVLVDTSSNGTVLKRNGSRYPILSRAGRQLETGGAEQSIPDRRILALGDEIAPAIGGSASFRFHP